MLNNVEGELVEMSRNIPFVTLFDSNIHVRFMLFYCYVKL
jgi:hypothetical protein